MIDPTPQTAVIPDMQSPESAYATWLPQGFRPGQVVRMEGVFLRAHNMDHLIRTGTSVCSLPGSQHLSEHQHCPVSSQDVRTACQALALC